jgi:hypothetical protein
MTLTASRTTATKRATTRLSPTIRHQLATLKASRPPRAVSHTTRPKAARLTTAAAVVRALPARRTVANRAAAASSTTRSPKRARPDSQ